MFRVLSLILVSGMMVGCASQPQVFEPAPALREIFRGGEIKGLENNQSSWTGLPGAYDLVEHSCYSMPSFNLYGQYVGTIVKCH